ncbi:MAG TPA: amidohydrolase family protein [Micromonosporaceae bacterium]|nr:amidohydrolase family protein [Micromonosporaceae bacterium]
MPGIDLHTHLAPDLTGAELPGVHAEREAVSFDGRRVGPPDLYRPDRLDAYLDTVGLDEAIVSVPPPFYRQQLAAAESAAWVAAVNEGLLRRVEQHPRLTPLAYLPLEHPQVAAAEYERIAGDARWAGVVGSAGGGSVSLAEPALRQLWQRLDEDGRLVQLHPGHATDPRLEPYYLANLLGNPMETAVAAAQLVFGEVLSEYPRIRFMLLHCGGCLPGVVGRWERGHATQRPGVPSLTLPPAEAVRRFYVDALAHDPALVDLAVTVFGAERLVLGSDWPFPMGTEDPFALVAHLGPEYVTEVASTNAAAALGRDA